MRQMRKNLLHYNPVRPSPNAYKSNDYNNRNDYDQASVQNVQSNQQLLNQISNDAEYFKNHQIYEEVNTAHK